MLHTITARGALRSLLAATPPLRINILIRSISQTAAKTKPTPIFCLPSHSLRASPKRGSIRQRLRFFHISRARKNKPTSPNPGSPSSLAVEAEPQTLGARMRKLFQEYGWSAAGVYFTLSALDYPLCYLLVKTLGTDKIGEWEHNVVSTAKQFIPESVKQMFHEWRTSGKKIKREGINDEQISKHIEKAGWSVEKAEKKNTMNASLATQLAFALAIHKSFIFVRVPLAAAITPNVVRLLRSWGWDIGKRTTKEVKAIKKAHRALPKSKIDMQMKP